MNYLPILKTAYQALTVNAGRSLLTILGIVIGIVSIVLVVALGQGARGLILGEIQTIGGNMVVVRPGKQPEGPADFPDTILADSIRDADVQALRDPLQVPGVASVNPGVLVSGAMTHESEVYRPFTLGWTSQGMIDFFGIYPAQGDYFTDDDVRRRAKVIVLGDTVKQELFGDSDAVGAFVRLRKQNFRVVGVLPPTGQNSLFNVDELALIPYATAQKDVLGISHYHEVIVRAHPGVDPAQVAADVRATLRDLHGIDDPKKDDFFVLTQEDIVQTVGRITQTLTIFLVAISSIALVVGGVGIMNIMLVSVTERTAEIGLRKAVGATRRDIGEQFLLEAVLLTGAGGAVGTGLALFLSFAVGLFVRHRYGLPWPTTIPVGAVLLGIGVAVVCGAGFGFYPAQAAARKDPITALRYE